MGRVILDAMFCRQLEFASLVMVSDLMVMILLSLFLDILSLCVDIC